MSTADPNIEHRHALRPNEEEHRASDRVRWFIHDIQHLTQDELALFSDVLRERLSGLIEPANDELAVGRVIFTRFVRKTGLDSSAAYSAWHGDQLDSDELFSPRQMRRIFGGPERRWEIVKQTLGTVPVEDVTTARLLKRATSSRADLMIEALHVYRALGDRVLRESDFVAWCCEQMESDEPLVVGPLPGQGSQIRRAFGSWPGFLREAGLEEEAVAAEQRLRVVEMSRAEGLQLLREFAADRTVRQCNASQLNTWLKEQPDERFQARQRPRSSWFESEFGGLPRAFYVAGVFSITEFALKLGGQLDHGEEVALATLAAAISDRGQDISWDELRRWRLKVVSDAGSEGHLLLVQCPDTLSRLIGSDDRRLWLAARQIAIDWLADGGVPKAGVMRDDLLEQP